MSVSSKLSVNSPLVFIAYPLLAHLSRSLTRCAYSMGLEPASVRLFTLSNIEISKTSGPIAIKRGTFICAHAWIFFKLCMIITICIQAKKMYSFNSITKTRTREATLTYSHYEVIPVSKVLCPNS